MTDKTIEIYKGTQALSQTIPPIIPRDELIPRLIESINSSDTYDQSTKDKIISSIESSKDSLDNAYDLYENCTNLLANVPEGSKNIRNYGTHYRRFILYFLLTHFRKFYKNTEHRLLYNSLLSLLTGYKSGPAIIQTPYSYKSAQIMLNIIPNSEKKTEFKTRVFEMTDCDKRLFGYAEG